MVLGDMSTDSVRYPSNQHSLLCLHLLLSTSPPPRNGTLSSSTQLSLARVSSPLTKTLTIATWFIRKNVKQVSDAVKTLLLISMLRVVGLIAFAALASAQSTEFQSNDGSINIETREGKTTASTLCSSHPIHTVVPRHRKINLLQNLTESPHPEMGGIPSHRSRCTRQKTGRVERVDIWLSHRSAILRCSCNFKPRPPPVAPAAQCLRRGQTSQRPQAHAPSTMGTPAHLSGWGQNSLKAVPPPGGAN